MEYHVHNNLYHSLGYFSRRQIGNIFFLFSPERIWHFLQIVSIRDNLHELPKPIFWDKIRKLFQIVVCWNVLPSRQSVKEAKVHIKGLPFIRIRHLRCLHASSWYTQSVKAPIRLHIRVRAIWPGPPFSIKGSLDIVEYIDEEEIPWWRCMDAQDKLNLRISHLLKVYFRLMRVISYLHYIKGTEQTVHELVGLVICLYRILHSELNVWTTAWEQYSSGICRKPEP